MNIPIIGDIINAVGNGVKSWNDGRVRIKEAKINAKVAKYVAEGKRWEIAQQSESDWDMEALRQSQYSWKDEWLTIIITLPYIGAFIPQLQDYVQQGFVILDSLPEWYKVVFLGIVAASFGLRWWFNKKKV